MSRTLYWARVVFFVLVLGRLGGAQAPPPAPAWTVGKVVAQLFGGGGSPIAPDPALKLAFIFDPSDDIFTYRSLGSSPRKIAQGVDPVFSPDGGMIVYCGFLQGRLQLMIAKSDGSGQKRLTDMEGSPCAPAWSPDGRKIAFHTATDNGQAVMVLDFSARTITQVATGSMPRWSPDGQRILFLRKPETHGATASIWVADADGKNARLLVESFSRIPSAAWSSDGRFIVYSNDDHHRSAIFRVNLDGTNPEEIAGYSGVEMYFPSMSPDDRQLVVVKAEGTLTSLTLVDLSTHRERWLGNALRGDVSWVRTH